MTATLAFLDEPQLGAAVSLSQAEGWPHTIADWALMLRIGRGVALREGDDLRGTAVFIPYGEVDGAVAMVLVAKDARRHGLGRSLMTEVIAQAPERQLRLVSTASAVPLYQSLGFEPAGRVYQMEGWPDVGGLGPRNGVVLAMEGETPAILGLDKAAFLYAGDYLDETGHLEPDDDNPRPRRSRNRNGPSRQPPSRRSIQQQTIYLEESVLTVS